MQDEYCFREFCHVHNSKYSAGISDANFPDSWPNIIKRLPVVRVQAGLNLPKLKSGFAPRIMREVEEILIRGTNPANFFIFIYCIKFYTKLCSFTSPLNVCLIHTAIFFWRPPWFQRQPACRATRQQPLPISSLLHAARPAVPAIAQSLSAPPHTWRWRLRQARVALLT